MCFVVVGPLVVISKNKSEILAIFAFSANVSGPFCNAAKAVGGAYCGCDNPIAFDSACRICGGTNLLPNTSSYAVADGDFEVISCLELEFFANAQNTNEHLERSHVAAVRHSRKPQSLPRQAPRHLPF